MGDKQNNVVHFMVNRLKLLHYFIATDIYGNKFIMQYIVKISLIHEWRIFLIFHWRYMKK